MQRTCIALMAWIVCLGHCSVDADVFHLTTGGSIQGKLENPGEEPRASYLVRTESGALLKLTRRQVRQYVPATPAQVEYAAKLPKMADTVEAHMEMALWCQKNYLSSQRIFHLEQVLRHDTDHKDARLQLGYSKYERYGGTWMTLTEYNKRQGYVRYKGDWRTPQAVAALRHEELREARKRKWNQQLRIWRGWLGKRRHADALRNIRAIRDPSAASILADMLEDEKSSTEVRMVLVDVLKRLRSGTAARALVKATITDSNETVRDKAIDGLRDARDIAVPAFIAQLKSKSTQTVNRAAFALNRLGDPAAIEPLIDVLRMKQKVALQSGRSPGSIGASFSRDGSGGGGLSAGSSPKFTTVVRENPNVLNALVKLTDVNFGYDQDRWRDWYALENTPKVSTLRRDR